MRERCPKAKPLETRVLENWQLCFKGVADIFPSEGSIVNVGVYKITRECENALDYYEDYPNLYQKKFSTSPQKRSQARSILEQFSFNQTVN